MEITHRQITKIAREVNKFTVRTMKADGIGTAEFDLFTLLGIILALRRLKYETS